VKGADSGRPKGNTDPRMETGRETKGRRGEGEKEITELKKKPSMLNNKLGIPSLVLRSMMTKAAL